jgi:hypothetical protein
MRVIRGEDTAAAHGSRAMPIWGELFASIGGPQTETLWVNALMKYLESIQAR